MPRVSLPDGRMVDFPDGMSRDAMKAALQKKFPPQPQQSALMKYAVNPFAIGVGGGVVERFKGVQQAMAPEAEQNRLGGEIDAMQAQRESLGWPTKVGGVIGRDVLGPVAATVGFANPLSAAALGTAGVVGAGMGYTQPDVKAQTLGERSLNAGTNAVTSMLGQGIFGYLTRPVEKIAGRVLGTTADEASNGAKAAGDRVVGDVQGAAREAMSKVDEAWTAVRAEAAGKTIPYKKIPLLQQTLMDAQAASGDPIISSQLTALNRFVDAGLDVPAETIIKMRQGLSKASTRDAGLREAVNGLDDILTGSLKVKSLPEAIRLRREYGNVFEASPQVNRIVTTPQAAGEEALLAAAGAGTGAGKRSAARTFDEFVVAGAAPKDIATGTLNEAYRLGGKSPQGFAGQLVDMADRNASLAEKVLRPGEIAAARSAAVVGKGGLSKALNYTTGALVPGAGIGLYAAANPDSAEALGPYGNGLMAAGLLAGGTKLGLGQYADDYAAQSMAGLLSQIGVKPNMPGMLSKLMGGTGSGLGISGGGNAFSAPRKRKEKARK